MLPHTTATIRWTLAVGILIFAIAFVASSCASFEVADAHSDLGSHGVFSACHNLTNLTASRTFSLIFAVLMFLIAVLALGTLFQRIELEKFLPIYSQSDQYPISFANHLQRALREGILHSREYIRVSISSG